MTLSLQILLILSVLGVAQAGLLAVALLRTKRGNLVSNRLLSAFGKGGLKIFFSCVNYLAIPEQLVSFRCDAAANLHGP
jgi:hypothetical protein